MLRAARSGNEFDYAMVAGAVRRGTRPPKLDVHYDPCRCEGGGLGGKPQRGEDAAREVGCPPRTP